MILRSLKLVHPSQRVFPFNLPLIHHLEHLDFTCPITFFVGENGSGKSTLLEGVAAACNLPTIGSASVDTDPSLKSAREFADHIKLTWSIRSNRGFFLRAEDFFGFVKQIEQLKAALKADVDEFSSTLTGYGRLLATGSVSAQLQDLKRMYGDLDAISHGEGFLKLFSGRLIPNALFLLDEPEAALSPTRQLTLISLIKEEIGRGSQFIIATHSPILMAMEESQTLVFSGDSITPTPYGQVEHFTLTKSFLDHPEAFLRRL